MLARHPDISYNRLKPLCHAIAVALGRLRGMPLAQTFGWSRTPDHIGSNRTVSIHTVSIHIVSIHIVFNHTVSDHSAPKHTGGRQ